MDHREVSFDMVTKAVSPGTEIILPSFMLDK